MVSHPPAHLWCGASPSAAHGCGFALRLRTIGGASIRTRLPEVGALDAHGSRVEVRILPFLHLTLVVAQDLEHRLLDDEDAHDVEPRHEAHADVAQRPR